MKLLETLVGANWRTTLSGWGFALSGLLAALAAAPYELGAVAEIVPPEWKPVIFKVSAVAAFLLKLINASVAKDAPGSFVLTLALLLLLAVTLLDLRRQHLRVFGPSSEIIPCAPGSTGIFNHMSTQTPTPFVRFLNTGIKDERLRALLAELLYTLPVVQEVKDEEDTPCVFDELAERHSEELASALRRAGHKVTLSEENNYL